MAAANRLQQLQSTLHRPVARYNFGLRDLLTTSTEGVQMNRVGFRAQKPKLCCFDTQVYFCRLIYNHSTRRISTPQKLHLKRATRKQVKPANPKTRSSDCHPLAGPSRTVAQLLRLKRIYCH